MDIAHQIYVLGVERTCRFGDVKNMQWLHMFPFFSCWMSILEQFCCLNPKTNGFRVRLQTHVTTCHRACHLLTSGAFQFHPCALHLATDRKLSTQSAAQRLTCPFCMAPDRAGPICEKPVTTKYKTHDLCIVCTWYNGITV